MYPSTLFDLIIPTLPEDHLLADPLLLFEKGMIPERPIPPFFLPVGGGDPLCSDSLRMQVALQQLGVDAVTKVYGRELHAFHAFIWRKEARNCWRDMIEFTTERLNLD